MRVRVRRERLHGRGGAAPYGGLEGPGEEVVDVLDTCAGIGVLYVAAVQVVQALGPTAALYVPALQCGQALAPAAALYVPAGQLVQALTDVALSVTL